MENSTKTENLKRTWYSEQEGLTLESLIGRINNEGKAGMIDMGVILTELYLNKNSEGILSLKEALINCWMKGKPDTQKQKIGANVDCTLFFASQVANGYLSEINNISYMYERYNAFDNGEVTGFYKKVTGFDPVAALPFANKYFKGELHPKSKRKAEEIERYLKIRD